jgi:hypothetical protein
LAAFRHAFRTGLSWPFKPLVNDFAGGERTSVIVTTNLAFDE